MSRARDFDIGPLTWVKGEIDQALERSVASLRAFVADPSDSNQIRFAQTHFHQAHGALAIVGLDGVTRLSDEIEGLLAEIGQAGGPPPGAAVAAFDKAVAAISAYLSDLLSGEANQPLMLLAVYAELCAARGKDAPDPAELYFPDLTQRPPRREKAPVALTAGDAPRYYRESRGRYQRGLLKWLKKDASGAEDMRAAVAAIEAAQSAPAHRAFWWVALALFDALVARSLPEDARLQRLCNRIEQQMKRLIDGSPTVAERLMREALFQVARARPATPHLRAVQETYRLAGTVPATFELRTDRGSAEPVLAAIRELVVQAKGAWTKFSSGHLASLAGFGEQVAALGARAGELGNPDLGVLGRAMSAVASALAGHPERFGDATAMEVATTLLLVENALERLDSLSPEFHEQAAVMSARLAACAKGEPPTAAPDVPLLDEMSRRAQERLLMAQVVAEMQSNLRAIEQALDAFFRAPDKRTELPGLDKPVKQVVGALTMLGEERAATVLAECEQNIRRFGAPEYEPDKADFESIAAALSGLGFYVDALQHGKADFDAMMKPLAPATPTPVEEVEVHSPAVTVEVELEQAKRQARTLYEAWRETPADEGLRAELRRNLAAIQKDAGLVADAALEKKAAEAQKLVAAEATRAFDPALQSAMFAIAGAPIVEHAPSAETAKLAESSSEAIDAELLAIFLEEATEVLESIRTQLDEAKGRPQAVEVLRTIRRGFHTLKGSGRMVGLARLGEAAWAVEQVMNRWLEDEQAGTPDLFKLVAFAHAYFAAGVVALKAGGTCPDEQQVVAAADRLKQGEPLGELSLSVETPVSAVAPTEELEIAVSEGGAVGPAEPPPTPTSDALDAIRPPAAVEPITLDFALPEAQADSAPEAVAVPERGNELPSLDFSMPLSVPTEAQAPAPETLSLDFALDEPTEADAASSAPADEPASLDFSMAVATPTTASAPPHEIHAVPSEAPAQEELVRIGEVELSPALYAIFVSEAQSHLAAMRAGAEALGDGIPVSETFQRAAHTLAGIAGAVRLDALRELGHALELALARSHDTFPAAEDGALFAEAIAAIEKMVEDASARRLPAATPELVARLDVVGVAAATPPAASSVDVDAMESNVEQGTAPCEPVPEVADAQAPADPVSLPLPEMAAHAVAEPAQPVSDRVVAFPGVTDEPSPAPSLEVKVEEIPVERRQRRLDDDLDRELLPIFLEEAAELVPSVGQSLRDWGAQPENRAVGHRLQRLLHTLKGSARMCGAMALGELTHAMETRIENALALSTIPATLLDELELSYDRMGSLYDRLQHPDVPEPEPERAATTPHVEAAVAQPIAPPPNEPDASALRPASSGTPTPHSLAAPPPAATHVTPPEVAEGTVRAMLRVRADMIDRLVNEAGEVAIARSRIDGEMRALKGALSDLTENVARLRHQLREIEIHAESQMASRLTVAQERELPFDPLEFDRFTRFQELTRMMAESVNDVQTVHQTIIKALDESEAALSAQARLNRELQQNLMRIRMVPFHSIAERLYRVVRQAAKELDKRAVLDIHGGQVELDRSVLERITAPFEHLLRNAVAHGIEPPATRLVAGKKELGEIKIELRQEGNEVMMAVSDDGAGIDVGRVRAKAIALGLLEADSEVPDTEVAELIFHPGFSTATEVSQIAGRGVGMDVVKSEVQTLGGRVETTTVPGTGSRFTIYLPLTLAVTQAVLVRAAGGIYAIPSAIVEQVRQLKEPELATCRESGFAAWQDRRYPFRALTRLLGDNRYVPERRRLTPALYARSGANSVALEVDEVLGNQEIVVKNAGPLLSRIPGITGATVLGSGKIVLIINPVILALRESVAAGEQMLPAVPAPAVVMPTVMIVDDSLTVRKITGRLLAREGFHVVTAKDGVDAVEQLQDLTPDVMLVDIEMPRMDGFDLTRNVRTDRRLAQVPIIMITSRTAEKHRAIAKQIGVDVFLGKPYQEEELLAHVARFAKKALGQPA